jgi:hypothetical protein
VPRARRRMHEQRRANRVIEGGVAPECAERQRDSASTARGAGGTERRQRSSTRHREREPPRRIERLLDRIVGAWRGALLEQPGSEAEQRFSGQRPRRQVVERGIARQNVWCPAGQLGIAFAGPERGSLRERDCRAQGRAQLAARRDEEQVGDLEQQRADEGGIAGERCDPVSGTPSQAASCAAGRGASGRRAQRRHQSAGVRGPRAHPSGRRRSSRWTGAEAETRAKKRGLRQREPARRTGRRRAGEREAGCTRDERPLKGKPVQQPAQRDGTRSGPCRDVKPQKRGDPERAPALSLPRNRRMARRSSPGRSRTSGARPARNSAEGR